MDAGLWSSPQAAGPSCRQVERAVIVACPRFFPSPVFPTLQEAPLHFKKIDRFWAVRVGLHYRALAVRDEADVVWFWIGPHVEYDRLIRQV